MIRAEIAKFLQYVVVIGGIAVGWSSGWSAMATGIGMLAIVMFLHFAGDL